MNLEQNEERAGAEATTRGTGCDSDALFPSPNVPLQAENPFVAVPDGPTVLQAPLVGNPGAGHLAPVLDVML